MAIIHVTGDPRAGKTSWVVSKIIREKMQFYNSNYSLACKAIKEKNRATGATRALPPQRHVVSGNILISRRYPNMSIYPMSGWEFGAPNKFCKTRAFIPHGVYVFDEAQRYFDSKGDGKELPPWVTQAFELHGHIFLEIFLITQRPVRLHKDIRAICSERIHIEKSIHTYIINGKKKKSEKFLKEGQLIRTDFYGRQFKSSGEHEAYVDGEDEKSKKLGKSFKDHFNGDIRDYYNPYEYAVEMEDLNQDFNYIDYGATERPKEWSNWKQKKEKEEKEAAKNEKNRNTTI